MRDSNRMTRRTFIRGASAAAFAAGCAGKPTPPLPTEPLPRRTLGRTGLEITRLACGSVGEHVLHAALDAGINYIDTAPCYPDWRGEATIGKVLKARKTPRDQIVIATKIKKEHFARIRPTPPKGYVESVEQSLKRLGTDYVDILVQHEAEFEHMNDEEVLDAFAKLKKAGKVRFLGAANHSHHGSYALDAALESNDYDMFMVVYNPFDAAQQLNEVLHRAKEKNVGILAMKAVMLLKGAEHRQQNPNFIKEMKRRAKEQRRGLNLYQTSIAWVLGHDPIASVCITYGNVQELREDMAASAVQLSALERIQFQRYARVLRGSVCDWCGACLAACPNGIAIPDIARFSLYYHVVGDRDRAREEYAQLQREQKAANCADCGRCEKACPQHLPVRGMLREAEASLA
ncbi:MAG: 4Fe-4S dicluster domain-containing protein [Planctomycetes bacterium]|nr:4Fe-4S dicluster domain-containing protein [Planctomycetota bacterium]